MPDQLLGGLIINEIFVDPNSAGASFDTDGNGTAENTDEFLELRNISTTAIDISGVQIWDAGVGNWFTFPPGTVLEPGAHALVVTGVQTGGTLPSGGPDDLAFDAGRGTAALNNGPENVVVYDPATDTFIQATYNGDTLDDPTSYADFSASATRSGAGEDFGSDIDGFSIQRRPDDTFVNDQTPTPATQNICFCDGTPIDTDDGAILVEDIHPGQRIRTMDHGAVAVLWVHARTVDAVDMIAEPACCPSSSGLARWGQGCLCAI